MNPDEQRQHPRFPKKLAVDVHVFILPASPSDTGYEAQGRTLDIGRGGVLMRLDREVREGVKVRLRFWKLPPGVRLWPLMISGTILRLKPGDLPVDEGTIGAGSLLAIAFSEPLRELDVPEG
ncbi:MAG: PilZ domain-containing protein [Acidobacteriota bacterium]